MHAMKMRNCELMPVVRTALEQKHRVKMTVGGSSMLPFLRDGDQVQLEPLRAALRKGDIVLVMVPATEAAAARAIEPVGQAAAETRERYVMHRVVRVDGDGRFWLRGDGQTQREGPFPPRAAFGRVTRVWRGRTPSAGHDSTPSAARGVRSGFALDRGILRLAGLLWTRTNPLGPVLLRFALAVRRRMAGFYRLRK